MNENDSVDVYGWSIKRWLRAGKTDWTGRDYGFGMVLAKLELI